MFTFRDLTRRHESGRSTATTLIAVVVALIVLAGGAFAVYKVTKTEDEGTLPSVTAKAVFVAWQDGDRDAASAHMTDAALDALFAIKASDGKGLKFGTCAPVGATLFPRLCLWTRPGGQLGMRIAVKDGNNVIDAVSYGPAGLPPAGDDTPTG